MKYRFELIVSLKEGLLDPQGKAVQDALPSLGWSNVSEVRVGKHLELLVEAESRTEARAQVEEMADRVGRGLAERLKELTLSLYGFAAERALERGIVLADTKFEFGFAGGELILIDEALTPDSSRFWPADRYAPGGPQPSFDKQYVRDWLDGAGWDHEPPPPSLPAEVVEQTVARYREAYERITGERFDAYVARMGAAR